MFSRVFSLNGANGTASLAMVCESSGNRRVCESSRRTRSSGHKRRLVDNDAVLATERICLLEIDLKCCKDYRSTVFSGCECKQSSILLHEWHKHTHKHTITKRIKHVWGKIFMMDLRTTSCTSQQHAQRGVCKWEVPAKLGQFSSLAVLSKLPIHATKTTAWGSSLHRHRNQTFAISRPCRCLAAWSPDLRWVFGHGKTTVEDLNWIFWRCKMTSREWRFWTNPLTKDKSIVKVTSPSLSVSSSAPVWSLVAGNWQNPRKRVRFLVSMQWKMTRKSEKCQKSGKCCTWQGTCNMMQHFPETAMLMPFNATISTISCCLHDMGVQGIRLA